MCVYVYRYIFYQRAFTLISQRGEQDESIATVYAVFSVGVDLHSQSFVHVYTHTACGCVSIGNTCSVSLLVEWGNTEQQQPFLSQATRFSNS